MEFAEGYLTAIQHIARLSDIGDGWSWATAASLASALATFLTALIMLRGNRHAERAAKAAEQSASDSRAVQTLNHQSFIAAQRATLRREMAEQNYIRHHLLDRYKAEKASIAHFVMKTQEPLPSEMARALREMSWLSLNSLSSDLWKRLKEATEAWEELSLPHRNLTSPHELDETQRALHQYMDRIREAHTDAELRILHLRMRLEAFDPADPRNAARPLPEQLT